MNFQRGRGREEPEINLIPMIDVLLVILIFLMVTTTYAQFSGLQINLPQAADESDTKASTLITVSIDATEHYAINSRVITFSGVDELASDLRSATGNAKEAVLAINADARTPHQAVVNVMEAARLAGITSVTFKTEAPPK